MCMQATYIYLQPPSFEQLAQRVAADILANPPLHHEPADAAQAAAAEAVREASAAAAQPELFDSMLKHDPQVRAKYVGSMLAADVNLSCCHATAEAFMLVLQKQVVFWKPSLS